MNFDKLNFCMCVFNTIYKTIVQKLSFIMEKIRNHKNLSSVLALFVTFIIYFISSIIFPYFANKGLDNYFNNSQNQQLVKNISQTLYKIETINLIINDRKKLYLSTDINKSKLSINEKNISFIVEQSYKHYKFLKKNKIELKILYQSTELESQKYDQYLNKDLSKQLNHIFIKLDQNLSIPIHYYKKALDEFHVFYKENSIQKSLESNKLLSYIKTAEKSLIKISKNLKCIKKELNHVSKEYHIPLMRINDNNNTLNKRNNTRVVRYYAEKKSKSKGIDSRLDNIDDFNGWEGDTVVTLKDSSVWKQIDSAELAYNYFEHGVNPRVYVTCIDGTCKMKVGHMLGVEVIHVK